jgi:hypothetical protein
MTDATVPHPAPQQQGADWVIGTRELVLLISFGLMPTFASRAYPSLAR